jgi:hypothetical protein
LVVTEGIQSGLLLLEISFLGDGFVLIAVLIENVTESGLNWGRDPGVGEDLSLVGGGILHDDPLHTRIKNWCCVAGKN